MQTVDVSPKQALIVYPNYIAALGGAASVRIGVRSAWVKLADREIRLPASEIRYMTDDGLKLAEHARAWAYRNL